MNSSLNYKRIISEIPKEKLPECWNDDERMRCLYSSRSAFANNHERISKFQFWKKMIAIWCQHNQTCYFTLTEIKYSFIRNSCVPICLPDLMDEMKQNGELVSVEKLLEMPSKTWSNWAYNVFVSKPVSWSYDTFWSYLSKNDLKPSNIDEEFVFLSVLNEQSRLLFEAVPESLRLKLISLDELKTQIPALAAFDSKTLLLNVLELQRQQLANVMETKDDQKHQRTRLLVKFAKPNQTCPPISNIDTSRFKLEQTRKVLLNEISKLEDRIEKTQEEAKNYLSKNKKILAKNCLRRKLELDKIVVKRQAVLDNIEGMINQFETVEVDSHVLESYRKGVDGLKNIFKGSGIEDMDSVSDTMLDLEEVTNLNDEILSMISEPFGSANTTYDAEIEDELNELIAEEKLKANHPEPRNDYPTSTTTPSEIREQNSNVSKLTEPAKENSTNNEMDFDSLESIERRLLNLRSNSSFSVPTQPSEHAK